MAVVVVFLSYQHVYYSSNFVSEMSCCSEYDEPDDLNRIQTYDSQEIGPLNGLQIHLNSQNDIDIGEINSHDENQPTLENIDTINLLNDDEDESEEAVEDTDINRNEVSANAKKKAAVWDCITELRSGGAQCNFCDKTFKMQDKSTSNAIRHLQSVHHDKQVVKDMVQRNQEQQVSRKRKREESKSKNNQPSIANIFPRKGPIDKNKQKAIVEAIVKYLIKANRPFQDVEHYDFRNLLFTANSSFVCPSRTTITRRFDAMAEEVSKDLKNEVIKDVTDAGHKTIHIVTDHGTSSDVFRTKKNVVVASRTTLDFEIKTDTIALIKSDGNQTGFRIRCDVKDTLEDAVGMDPSWTVCWKTDGAANAVNARKPGAHGIVGLEIHFDGTCVDHTLELCCNDALNMKDPRDRTKKTDMHPTFVNAVKKMKTVVKYLSESSLARQYFKQVMTANDMNPLRTVKGTSNRFFSKFFEVDRFLEVRRAVDIFIDEYEDLPDYCEEFDETEWDVLKTYRDALDIIVKASVILEGRDYPTGSSVIPFLDSIHEELDNMKIAEPDDERKSFLKSLCDLLKKNNRFGLDLYKSKSPYRELTLLDPRYGNLYFDKEGIEMDQTIDALITDKIYDVDRNPALELVPRPPPQQQLNSTSSQGLSVFEKRRLRLLSDSDLGIEDHNANPLSLKDKIQEEVKFLLKAMKDFKSDKNVMVWYKENCSKVPLIAKFLCAYSAFPATSCGAERVFNVDGLIITDHR